MVPSPRPAFAAFVLVALAAAVHANNPISLTFRQRISHDPHVPSPGYFNQRYFLSGDPKDMKFGAPLVRVSCRRGLLGGCMDCSRHGARNSRQWRRLRTRFCTLAQKKRLARGLRWRACSSRRPGRSRPCVRSSHARRLLHVLHVLHVGSPRLSPGGALVVCGAPILWREPAVRQRVVHERELAISDRGERPRRLRRHSAARAHAGAWWPPRDGLRWLLYVTSGVVLLRIATATC